LGLLWNFYQLFIMIENSCWGRLDLSKVNSILVQKLFTLVNFLRCVIHVIVSRSLKTYAECLTDQFIKEAKTFFFCFANDIATVSEFFQSSCQSCLSKMYFRVDWYFNNQTVIWEVFCLFKFSLLANFLYSKEYFFFGVYILMFFYLFVIYKLNPPTYPV